MQSKALDKVKEAYEILVQWEADEAAGVAGTTDKPEAKSASEALFAARIILQEALRFPLRQCDVGTPEDQEKRFTKYCYDHRSYEIGCGGCPLNGEPCCELAWAQMPYAAEEGGAE